MADKQTEIKILAWHLIAKNLLKFVGDEKSYHLADNVLKANDFIKYPIRKGDSLSVDIKDDTVIFLRKAKPESSSKSESKGSEEAYEPTPEEEAPKVTPKVETPTPTPQTTPTVVGEERELTIFAVAANKKVLKFTECKDEGWFQIDESIQAQDYNVIGLVARNRVRVQIVENKVVSLVKVASEAPQPSQDKPSEAKEAKVEQTPVQTPKEAPTPKKEWKPASSYDTAEKQTSIECQACINASCQVVGMVASSLPQAPTANVLNQMIRAVAIENYNLLQDLKKK